MRKIWLVVAALALPLFAAVPLPPAPERHVTDAANVIEDSRELALNERLAQFARETSNQVIVYVDRELPVGSTSIKEMGIAAIRTWGVGDAQKDNGVILFLFVDSRESRIEVGYGLETILTDARTQQILVGLRPDLRAGDYTTAIEAGVTHIIAAITEAPAAVPEWAPFVIEPAPVRQFVPEPMPPARNDVHVDGGGGFPIVIVLFGGIGLLLVINAIAKNGGIDWSSGRRTHHPSNTLFTDSSSWPTSNTSSTSFGNSSSSGTSSNPPPSSGSGFSGGGGSGGGGGASDKW